MGLIDNERKEDGAESYLSSRRRWRLRVCPRVSLEISMVV